MNPDDRLKSPSWLGDVSSLVEQLARPGMGDHAGGVGEFIVRGWIAA